MNNELFDESKCACSNEKHFLTKPITLKCGHSVCQKCIPDENFKEIKCKICGTVSKKDFIRFSVSKNAQKLRSLSMADIFQSLEKETRDRLNKLKDQIKIKDETLGAAFDYIKDEIDVRVESVKIQVEELGIKAKEEVDKLRNEFLNSKVRDTKLSGFHRRLKDLQENIKTRTNLNEMYLHQYQRKMNDLISLITEIEDYKIPLIKISTRNIEHERLIGRFYSINKHNKTGVHDLLKIENKEYIQLDYHPCCLSVLSNNRLLVLNYLTHDDDTQCITIHDENYNLIKKINQINKQSFSDIQEITINQEKREVYLSDNNSDRIIVTDFELNFIKYFGSQGYRMNQFNGPLGICFKNGYLYVSDGGNYRIQIFNQNLEFIKSLKLEYIPIRVQTSNSMLAVTSEDGINFYDLNSLEFHSKFDYKLKYGLNLSEINSIFYGFDYKTNEMFCFDSNGYLIEQINLNENDLDGKLVLLNKSLLTNSYKARKIIKFK